MTDLHPGSSGPGPSFRLKAGAIIVSFLMLIGAECCCRLVGTFLDVENNIVPRALPIPSRSVFISSSRSEGEFMVTNPEWVGLFNYQEFRAHKERNTFRIFCLGGSSTYGYPFGASLAWPRWVATSLISLFPGHSFEVINAGADCYGSSRVRLLFNEISAFEPDLVIIYSGNNEFLEPLFSRQLGLWERTSRRIDRLCQSLAIYQVLKAGWSYLLGSRSFPEIEITMPSTDPEISNGQEQFLLEIKQEISGPAIEKTIRDRAGMQTFISQRDRTLTYALFEYNFRSMAERAAQLHIPLLFLTVPVNLKDWPPGLSWSEERGTTKQGIQCSNELSEAWSLIISNNLEKAAEIMKAYTCKDTDALASFISACLHLQVHDDAQALELFAEARDSDLLPLRVTAPLNDTIRRVAAASSTAGLLDLEQIFSDHSSRGLPGYELFWDMCHPTVSGHKLISQEIIKWFLQHQRQLLPGPPSPVVSLDQQVAIQPDLPTDPHSPWSADMIAQMGYLLESINRFVLAEKYYQLALGMDQGNETARAGLTRSRLFQKSPLVTATDPFHKLRENIDEEITSSAAFDQISMIGFNHD